MLCFNFHVKASNSNLNTFALQNTGQMGLYKQLVDTIMYSDILEVVLVFVTIC